MFASAQIVTTKLVHRSRRKELLDAQVDDKTTHDLLNMTVLVPRSKAAIVVETRSEKLERKALAQERRHERLIEQQKIAQQMEDLMEKVIHEIPISRKDEDNLRHKINTIMTKVNKGSDKIDVVSRIKSDSIEQSSQSNRHSKPANSTNQGAFLLWHDKNRH